MRLPPTPRKRKAGPLPLALLLAGVTLIIDIPAQAPLALPQAESAPQPAPYVLHVYTDLLRVPALVVDRRDMPLTSLTLQSFQLQIDSGPSFRPTALHMEDTEPLSLALVLDASGAEADLLKTLPLTPGKGLPATLLPHDTVSVYAFDCHIIRSARDLPFPNATTLNSVPVALNAPNLHGPRGRNCRDRKRLWDAIGAAVSDLGTQPGWRVVLVLADGEDGGSLNKWEALRDTVTGHSVTIFGLDDRSAFYDAGFTHPANSLPRGLGMSSCTRTENLFAELVSRSGGEILSATGKDLGRKLDHILALLRSRYILQFSRPMSMEAGQHHLDVHTSARDAIVLASGVSVPMRDTAILNDPTTVPTDTSRLPVPGKRKPMSP